MGPKTMRPNTILGLAHCFGDNIDTGQIIPGKFMISTRLEDMAPYAMHGVDPEFAKRVRPGDILVAGRNFGCGSSREAAPNVLRGCGVRAVIAESFARLFFRNAINLGLFVVECPGISKAVSSGDQVRYDPATGTIENLTRAWQGQGTVLPDFLMQILEYGGAAEAYRASLREGPKRP